MNVVINLVLYSGLRDPNICGPFLQFTFAVWLLFTIIFNSSLLNIFFLLKDFIHVPLITLLVLQVS